MLTHSHKDRSGRIQKSMQSEGSEREIEKMGIENRDSDWYKDDESIKTFRNHLLPPLGGITFDEGSRIKSEVSRRISWPRPF